MGLQGSKTTDFLRYPPLNRSRTLPPDQTDQHNWDTRAPHPYAAALLDAKDVHGQNPLHVVSLFPFRLLRKRKGHP